MSILEVYKTLPAFFVLQLVSQVLCRLLYMQISFTTTLSGNRFWQLPSALFSLPFFSIWENINIDHLLSFVFQLEKQLETSATSLIFEGDQEQERLMSDLTSGCGHTSIWRMMIYKGKESCGFVLKKPSLYRKIVVFVSTLGCS